MRTAKIIAIGALIVLVSLLLRAPADLRDGLSERPAPVGWWAWHVLGWIPRDISLQGAFIWIATGKAAKKLKFECFDKWLFRIVVYAHAACYSIVWHDWLYDFGLKNRHLFDW